MNDQEKLLQLLIQLLSNPGQLQPMEGMLAQSMPTLRGMKESGVLDTPTQQGVQQGATPPTYDPKRTQEYYDQRQRKHPNTGLPMSEEDYQKMLRSLPKR